MGTNLVGADNLVQENRAAKKAVILWICMMAAYTCMGVIQILWGISLGIWTNIIFSVVCILLMRKDGQGLSCLGLSKEHLAYSCKIGMICSLIIVVINGILPGILNGKALAPLGGNLLRLLYFLFIIALPEEIIFRGYILTRLESVMRTSMRAILLSGVFFMLIHIPYQYIVSGKNFLFYMLNGNLFTLVMTFIWHLVFCFIFRKTKSIYGVVLFHGLMDWSNYLFV